MLQRAASNACSWWWASHIRTKQSKWLEQCLQDMEEKVQSMLKLIEEDGDSFAKRAEMYYKRRPELISSVEESYRAFKALADRYDLLSKDLQNANHTIATVFPEQVQFAMEEADDCPPPKPKPKPKKKPQLPGANTTNVPKVPKAPIENIKGLINTASKKFQAKKPSKEKPHIKPVVKSGLNKDEALGDIDKLHKEILTLQTVKEFVKSSYEGGLAKYWEIENQIIEKQEKVSKLQDEFEVETVIEDNEARTLMAEAALKSCQETLAVLQEKQEKSTREAQEESKKIETARRLLRALRRRYMKEQTTDQNPSEDDKTAKAADESQTPAKDVCDLIQESKIVDTLQENTDKKLDQSSMASLTVTELAEKIDELVNKVISLETEVSSQTVLINTLRTEADDLHAQIRNLEDERESLIGDTQNLNTRVQEMEAKLNRIQDLNKNVESQNSNLESNFAEARSSLDHLSEKLSNVKPDEEIEGADSSQDKAKSSSEHKLQKVIKDQKDVQSPRDSEKSSTAAKTEETEDVKEVHKNIQVSESSVPKEEVKKTITKTAIFLDKKPKEQGPVDHSDKPVKAEAEGDTAKDLNWQQMLLNGTEDRETILLKEYTAILRNYKDVKKKLRETEKKERDNEFDLTVQMRELKEAIRKKDQEILHLRQKLELPQGNKDVKEEGDLPSNTSGDQSVKPESGSGDLEVNEDLNTPVTDKEDEIKLDFIDRNPVVSVIEEKLRLEIDAILDENLDFWLRFSTAFHQVQKFKSEAQDLHDEVSKLKERKKQEGIITAQLKSEARPIYKHMREIQTELTVWLEQSASLKDELKRRFASLCDIQEEITKALKDGVEEEEIRFSSHQAAKLQGEILNMKQENNKVREELQTALDHASMLQLEMEKTLRQLMEEFGISSDQPQLQHSMSRSRVPLRSFIFGTKPKKQKNSLFSFMHHNRKFQVVRAGVPLSHHH